VEEGIEDDSNPKDSTKRGREGRYRGGKRASVRGDIKGEITVICEKGDPVKGGPYRGWGRNPRKTSDHTHVG